MDARTVSGSLLPKFNLNITQKIILLFIGLLGTTTLLQGEFLTRGNNNVIVNKEFQVKQLQERLHAEKILQDIFVAKKYLEILNKSPTVTSIMRASQNGTIDPFDGSTLDTLKYRLQTTFTNLIQYSPEIYQLRLIGIEDGGREIVRVERSNDQIVVTPETQLQQKAHRDYFAEIAKLRRGQIYTSNINLNREHGKIEYPYKPTIRLGIPLFQDKRNLFGMILININFSSIVNKIREHQINGEELYIVNQYGDYLLHPDESLTYGFDLTQNHKVQDDIHELSTVFNPENKIYEKSIKIKTGTEDYLLQYQRFDIDPDTGRYIGLIHRIPYEIVIQEATNIRNQGILITFVFLFLGALMALLLSAVIVRPLRRITRAAIDFANGYYDSPLENKSQDEVGVLSRAFDTMIEGIRTREQAIVEKEARYRSIFNSAHEGILLIDNTGKIQEANPAMTLIFGYSNNELAGNSLNLLYPDIEIDCDNRVSRAVVKRNKTEDYARHKNGRKVPTILSIGEFGLYGTRHFATVIHDLTDLYTAKNEQKRLEIQLQQAQKMEAIGQVSSGLAHDFNNVLTSIIGYSDLAQHALLQQQYDKVEEYLEVVDSSARSSSETIHQLLVFSRKQNISFAPTDVGDLLKGTIKIVRGAMSSSLNITLNIESNLPLAIMNDVQFQQVILNLCINSRDAMKKNKDKQNEITIDVHLTELSDTFCSSCHQKISGNFLEVCISDVGSGIKKSIINRIFEPFYSTKASHEGTGMGLAMVHGSMHSAQGHIIVESREGEGTSFRLFFKIVQEE